MAQFGKRFRKARKRRQKAKQRFREERTKRIAERQETKRFKQLQKTERVKARQQGKSDRVDSKAQGGYYLPESVEARTEALMQGLKTAGTIGLAAATGGSSLAVQGIGSSIAGALGSVASESPSGAGFVTSGMEDEETDNEETKEDDLIFGLDPMLVYLAGGGLVLYFISQR